MKPHRLILASTCMMALASIAVAQQVPAPKTQADVTQPADGITMSPAYAKMIARSAYVWGWPMVNMLNRRAAITKAPHPRPPQRRPPRRPARADRHAPRLHRTLRDLRHLPQPGRRLRPRLLLPRRGTRHRAGPRLRRPILGLRPL